MAIYARGRDNDAAVVTRIQQMLMRLRVNVGPHEDDGKLGPDTEAAIKDFQRLYSRYTGQPLEASGVVDDRTLAAIEAATVSPELSRRFVDNRVLRHGHGGDDVKDLQNRLTAAGFPCGEIDGDFGNRTKAALVAYQEAHGLSADGSYGPATRAALEREARAGHAHSNPPPERQAPRASSRIESGAGGATVARAALPVRTEAGYGMISPLAGDASRSRIRDTIHSTRYVHRNGKPVLDENGNPIRRNHNGYDIHAVDENGNSERRNLTRPVVATLPGTVFARIPDNGSAGNTIILEHRLDNGKFLYTCYLHLNDNEFGLVHKGQEVAQGDRIGRLGATGNSSKTDGTIDTAYTHVHYAVYEMNRRATGWADIRDNGRPVELGPLTTWNQKKFDVVNGIPTPPPSQQQRMADAPPARLPVAEIAQRNFFGASPSLDFSRPLQPGLQTAMAAVGQDRGLADTLAQFSADQSASPEASLNRLAGSLRLDGIRLDEGSTALTTYATPGPVAPGGRSA